MAQAQSSGVLADFLPSSFNSNQFVDSAGCAFIRAGVGGAVTWVPRVDCRRNQLCSFQPTFAAAAPAPAPVVEAPAPVVAAAPTPAPARPARNVGAPIQTVASLRSTPSLVQIPTANTPTARSPQIVRNAPVLAAAPAPAPVATPAPAPRQTRGAFCEGRTGPQPGFVSSSTGQTIDCDGVRTAPVVRMAAVADTPLRMTMAQVCAEMRSTGRQFVNAQTGAAVRCGPQTQAITAGPAAPSGPVAPAAPTITARFTATANCPAPILAVEGQVVRCGPPTLPITTRSIKFTSDAQVARSTVSTSTAPLFGPPPVPGFNPVGVSQRQVLPVPKGYTRVWSDGRHNPNRGLPRATAIEASPVVEGRVSTRTAHVTTSHRCVQVGTFSNAANARATGQRFLGMGLPVGLTTSSRGSVVLLGPFTIALALNRGLSAARNAGFGDAFPRN